jgi:putative tricarboxylic transport membrane protein
MKTQTTLGAGTLLLGLGLAGGAAQISSEAGYAGVGPNFLPWVVSVMLTLCGAWLLWEARTGGFREMEAPSGAAHGHWAGFAWVSAGLLLNAALLTRIGFIPSCMLCFVLAVRGFKSAEARLDWRVRTLLADAFVGFAISAPVYWMFTKALGINLPGLTSTGWL